MAPPRCAATTHKTVKRIIDRHEAGEQRRARAPRPRNYDAVAELVAERVEHDAGPDLGEAAAAGGPGRRLCGVGRGTSAGWSPSRRASWRQRPSPGSAPGGVVAG